MIGAAWAVVKNVVGAGTEIAKGWQKRKSVKLEGELALARATVDAKIKRMETLQQGDIAWENTSIKNAGWKDEFWTIVLAIPCVLCFLPGMVDTVLDGFRALAECPQWYRWCLLVAISSSFGYKKLADFMALKKGG